jgi:hypothetical protein
MKTVFTLPTNSEWFPTVQVTLGILDTAATVAYSQGWCHIMMKAISEHTGWTDQWGAFTYKSADPCHVAVQRPDGLLVDVQGIISVDETTILDTDGDPMNIKWRPLDGSEIAHWWDGIPFTDDALHVARSLVEPVLDRARDCAALAVVS